jgi:hypothetical protein
MSTRANIHFGFKHPTSGKNVSLANVYRHYDGYPDGVLPGLEEFFGAVRSQTSDTRFGDPEYLAAKFVVWQAAQYAADPAKPLAFTGVGIATKDAGDGEYVYELDCASGDQPSVAHREVTG